jgi:hypothetical protein
MVPATGGWLVEFWGLWCQIAVEVGCIGYTVVKLVGDRECGNLAGECCSLAEVVVECCSLVEVAGVGCVEVVLRHFHR